VFQLRERRPRFGELIQIDGSPHDWFEGRAPRCTLIVFIDDATSRLTALRFAPVESGKAYLETLRDQVLTHWPSIRTVMAYSASTRRMRRAATARRSSAGSWNVWTSR
jgi:hypothetical protein